MAVSSVWKLVSDLWDLPQVEGGEWVGMKVICYACEFGQSTQNRIGIAVYLRPYFFSIFFLFFSSTTPTF